jgi:hypothetical protein
VLYGSFFVITDVTVYSVDLLAAEVTVFTHCGTPE